MKKIVHLVLCVFSIEASASASFSFSLLTAVLGANNSLAGVQGWAARNPGGGGQIQDIVCDPLVNDRLYLCSDMEGLYRSDDSGLSWEFIGEGLFDSAVMTVAVDPSDSNHLFAASECGIFISIDGGTSWDFAGDTEDRIFHELVIDPDDPDRIYAGPGHHELSMGTNTLDIMISRDGGSNWQSCVYQTGTGACDVYSIKLDPVDSSVVYLGGAQGVFKSTDYGDSWTKIARPAQSSGESCFGLDVSPNGNFIYAAYSADNSSSVFVAPASSMNWTKLASGLTDITGLYWRPTVDPRSTASQHKVLVGPRDGYGSANLFEGTFSISGSSVGGSWSVAADYNDGFDRGWYTPKHQFRHSVYSPTNWSVRSAWAASEFVFYEGSLTNRADWQLRSCQVGGSGLYSGRGFTSTYNFNVAGSDEYLITGVADVGVLESWDAGSSWMRAPVTTNRQGDSVLICETDPQIVLAGVSDGFGGGGTVGNLWAKKQVYGSSSDTWNLVAAGPTGLAGLSSLYRIGAMASDPNDPKHIILGGRKYAGLYEIDDIEALVNSGTGTFTKIFPSGGLSAASVRNIWFDPNRTNAVYILSNGGLYDCVKSGGTWSSDRIFDPGTESWTDPNAFVWSHNGQTRILMCSPEPVTNETETVLFYSDNGGESWSSVLSLGDVRALYDEGEWYDEWSSFRSASAFGFQDRFFVSANVASHGRKDLGLFCGHLKDGFVEWANWNHFGTNRFFYSAVRDPALVQVDGLPMLYLATTGAGVWRRALGEASVINPVYNGGFESGLLGPDWDDDWPKLETDLANVSDGRYAMRLKRSSVGNMQCRQTVLCRPSTSYALNAQVKTALNTGVAWVKADYLSTNNAVLGSVSSTPVSGTNDYASSSVSFTTPGGTAALRVYLQMPASAGTAWFDEVSLDELGFLNNPGFETGSVQPEWGDSWPQIDSTAANVHSGSYAVKLQRGSVGNMHCWQTAACAAGTDYTLSAWMKTALTSGSAGLKVEFYNGGTLLDTYSVYESAGISEYHPVFLDFTTPTNAASLKVFLQMPESSGTVWFDDVRLK